MLLHPDIQLPGFERKSVAGASFAWLLFSSGASLRQCLTALGPWAIVALGLSTAIYQPLGPDVFVLASASIRLSRGLAGFLAAVSTAVGACLGYAIGRGVLGAALSKILWKRQEAIGKAQAWLARRGVWVVAFAGLSPVPLTQVAWAAGVLRMRFMRFLGGLLLGLVPRFALEAIFSDVIRKWLGL